MLSLHQKSYHVSIAEMLNILIYQMNYTFKTVACRHVDICCWQIKLFFSINFKIDVFEKLTIYNV